MNILVSYDSQFGNTQQVADAIGKALNKNHSVQVKPVSQTSVADLQRIDLLFLGSPTQGGQAKPTTKSLISQIVAESIPLKYACFDTRFSPDNVGLGLKLLMSIIGYASPKMAKALSKNPAGRVIGEEGFIVLGKEGPLAEGELSRCQTWAKKLVSVI